MPLYHFACKPCDAIFEEFSSYDNSRPSDECVVPAACPQCGQDCGVVWLKAPGMKVDENLTAEEKVAIALRLGFGADGRLTVPQTRSDARKVREALGDIKVGEKELLSVESKSGDARTTSEREADKAQTIDFLRRRRAKIRAGEIDRRPPDRETAEALKSTPVTSTRILAKNGVR